MASIVPAVVIVIRPDLCVEGEGGGGGRVSVCVCVQGRGSDHLVGLCRREAM